MRFLVDAQLPLALATVLREYGREAEHITHIGPADEADREIWRYALEHDVVIVTKDEDFADMTATGRESPPVVWIPHRPTPDGRPCSHGSSRSSRPLKVVTV